VLTSSREVELCKALALGAVRPAAWLAEMVAAAAAGQKADPDEFVPESALGLGPGPAAVAAAAAAMATAAAKAEAKADAVAAAVEGNAAAAEGDATASADVHGGVGCHADTDANATDPETALAKAIKDATTDAIKALRAAGLTSVVVDSTRAVRLARRLRALAPLCAAADLQRRIAVAALAAWSQATDGMDWAVAAGRATSAVNTVGQLEEAVAALQAAAGDAQSAAETALDLPRNRFGNNPHVGASTRPPSQLNVSTFCEIRWLASVGQ